MLYVALQTNLKLQTIEDILSKVGFQDMSKPYKKDADMIYAASYGEPFESPKTLDDFTIEEIEQYLEDN